MKSIGWLKKILENWREYFVLALFLTNALVWYAVYREDRHGILTVAFLNVGEGNSVYIESPGGGKILFDGGPDRAVLRSLGMVMPFYDRSIDMILVSSESPEDFGGFFNLLPRYSVSSVVFPIDIASSSPEYNQFENSISGAKAVQLRYGMVLDLGLGAKLKVLNDNPLVLRLSYGKTSFLLIPDADKKLEDSLISSSPLDLRADVLEVPRHGSSAAVSEQFLASVAPKYAAISVGEKNSRSYPDLQVLNSLTKFGVKTFRTDRNGTVIFRSDGENLIVSGK